MEQIQFYRTDVAGRVPSPSNLAEGALAMNLSDKTLYTKDKTGKVIPIGGARDNLQTSVPMGSVVAWGTPAIPYGYLECAGQVVQKADWPEFVELMTGGKTATSYTMPDMRNKFLRGVLSPRLPFSHEGQEIQGHNHNASSSTLPAHSHTRGSMNITGGFIPLTGDAFSAKQPSISAPQLASTGQVVKMDAGVNFDASRAWTGNTSVEPAHTPTITVGTAGGAETRPANIGVKYIMRAAATLGDDGIITTSESLAKSQQAYDLASSMDGRITAINHTDGFTSSGKIRMSVESPHFGDTTNKAAEYLLVCPSKASDSNRQAANVVTGVLKGSLGSNSSGNDLINLDINVSDAYNWTNVNFENNTDGYQKLNMLVTLAYEGIRWIALECSTIGGSEQNGMFFEGEIISENQAIRNNMFKPIQTGYTDVVQRGLVPAKNSHSDQGWNLPVLAHPFTNTDSFTSQVKWRMKDMNTIEVIGIARLGSPTTGATIFSFPSWVGHRLNGSSYSPIAVNLTTGDLGSGYTEITTGNIMNFNSGGKSVSNWVIINHTIPLLDVLAW